MSAGSGFAARNEGLRGAAVGALRGGRYGVQGTGYRAGLGVPAVWWRPCTSYLVPVLALLLVGVLGAVPAFAQDVPRDTTDVTSDSLQVGDGEATRFEAIAEGDPDGDPTELLELIEDLAENPLDVNAATAAELATVPSLSPFAAEAIVRARIAQPFRSLPELQALDEIDADTYLAARPYLTIGPRLAVGAAAAPRFPAVPSLGQVLGGLRVRTTQRFQRRLDTQAGFRGPDSTRTFLGSPERLYTRIQAQYRRQVSVNLTLEKDPGEAFRFDGETNTYGYDYLSGHAAILDVGRIEALVLGDFVAEYGQGLALWRASGFGKGPDATRGPVRRGRGIRPYGSVDENNFFRGAALAVSITPDVSASVFASRRFLDASILEPDSTDLSDPDLPPDAVTGPLATSLNATGLHRTESELARKDALGETLVGGGVEGNLTTRQFALRGGVVGYAAAFDAPLDGGDRPDELFDLQGDQFTTLSAYADLTTRTVTAFGEASRSPDGAFGAVGGLGYELGGGAEVLAVGRSYPADFRTLHGYPFGERNGAGENEQGLYLGLKLKPSRDWTVNTYFDQYRFPFLRFGTSRPSTGSEALVFVEHRPRRWIRLYVQGRTETREIGIDVDNTVPGSAVGGLANQTRQTLRVQGEWSANRELRFRARVEGVRYLDPDPAQDTQTGALVFQDVRYQLLDWLRADARVTFFRTDGFDSRLYAFENDLTGVFAIPALSGRGTRAYVLLNASPVQDLSIQAKIAATFLRGVRQISSGASAIEGDRVRDLGLQVRYKF